VAHGLTVPAAATKKKQSTEAAVREIRRRTRRKFAVGFFGSSSPWLRSRCFLRLFVSPYLPQEALVARPGLDQRPIHREMLRRKARAAENCRGEIEEGLHRGEILRDLFDETQTDSLVGAGVQ
jgi:hypothetical protein